MALAFTQLLSDGPESKVLHRIACLSITEQDVMMISCDADF